MKIPKTLGECADLLHDLRSRRLAAQRVVEELRAQQTALENHIVKTLPKSKASGVAGRVARVRVETKDVPQVKDWGKFYRYVKTTGQFDLMQKRIAPRAIEDRLEEGEKVPGVEMFGVTVVHVNKL